jgi:hypothetical protein
MSAILLLRGASIGSYHVILDEHHFSELLLQHTIPPVAADKTQAALVRMAFPNLVEVPVLIKTDGGYAHCLASMLPIGLVCMDVF